MNSAAPWVEAIEEGGSEGWRGGGEGECRVGEGRGRVGVEGGSP